MKRLTRQWVAKAEADFTTAQRELRARKSPNHDAACFHSQQCIEKYLKARLQEADLQFARTHDLAHLLELAKYIEPMWEAFRPGLVWLSVFAVQYRYPGRNADRQMAKKAVRICREIRAIIRERLGA